MRNVDEICKEFASREKTINLLFLTVGTLQTGFSKILHKEAFSFFTKSMQRPKKGCITQQL